MTSFPRDLREVAGLGPRGEPALAAALGGKPKAAAYSSWQPGPPGSSGSDPGFAAGQLPPTCPRAGGARLLCDPRPWALPSLLGTQDCLKLLPTPKLGLALGSWLREWEGPAAPTPRPGKEDVGDRGEGGRGSLKRIWQERGWGRM